MTGPNLAKRSFLYIFAMSDCLLSGCGAQVCYIIGGVSLLIIISHLVVDIVLVRVINTLTQRLSKAEQKAEEHCTARIKLQDDLIEKLKAQPKVQEQEQQKSHSGQQKEEQKKEQKLSDHVVSIGVILYKIYKAIWT